MRSRALALFVFAAVMTRAVIIDRIAIVVGNAIIKSSDIERDIRVTDLLNSQPLSFDAATRKQSASRLVDQIFIRREIRVGDYRTATPENAATQIQVLTKDRYKGDSAYKRALDRYGLTDGELRAQFQWQLTVLNFIDARFKPAAYVSDQEIETYYNEHAAVLHRQFPGKSTLPSLQPEIRDILVGEKVNQLFFAWLEEQRKSAKIVYREESLR
jgi:parvulin-like peptidyl-prolyl isomerase